MNDRECPLALLMQLFDACAFEEVRMAGRDYLAAFPDNNDARILVAQADFRQGYFEAALAIKAQPSLDPVLEGMRRETLALARAGCGLPAEADGADVLSRILVAIENGEAPDDRDWTAWSRLNERTAQILVTRYLRRWMEERGEAPSRRPASRRDWISANSMRHYGRLAHTLRDYLSLKAYAGEAGLDVRTPEWQGHYLFGLDDPQSSPVDAFCYETVANPRNVDVFHPAVGLSRQGDISTVPSFAPAWEERFREAGKIVANRAVLHLRFGDMQRDNVNYPFDSGSFLAEVRAYRMANPNDVLHVISDDLESARALLDGIDVRDNSDLPEERAIVSHLRDFFLISKAKAAIASRGSFATTARLLSRHK